MQNSIGRFGRGNIDLYKRPIVKNPDGSFSTVRSMSFNDGRNEILIPTVSEDGRIMTDDEAIKHFYNTGNYLGIFNNPDEANVYAEQLHNEQQDYYRPMFVPPQTNLDYINLMRRIRDGEI
jgi:hypothetical protein